VSAMPKHVWDTFDKKNNRRYWVGLRSVSIVSAELTSG
jgi:hypothetical protein